MTSATEKLRRMLTERGIVWNGSDYPTNRQTTWNRGPHGIGARYLEPVGSSIVSWDDFKKEGPVLRIFECTPEQAIAATLGRGTCKHTRTFNLVKRECDGEYYEWHGDRLPNFCPHCGAKVVSADD